MKKISKNVYFADVTVVFLSTINADKLFINRDDAIKFTKEVIKEYSEELTEEEMKRYGYDKDVEDYIEEIKLNPSKDLRLATDRDGKLILESFGLDGEWHPCIYGGGSYVFSFSCCVIPKSRCSFFKPC